jgi:hypothetical protein
MARKMAGRSGESEEISRRARLLRNRVEGGGRLEEGERPDKRARPVSRSKRGKGKCGPAVVLGPKERSWAV